MRVLFITSIIILLCTNLRVQAQADFTASVTEGCTPLRVSFAIDTASYDISAITVAEWDFGNDSVVVADSPTDTVSTTYLDPKRYHVTLTINNDAENATTRSGLINATPGIDSDFSIVESAGDLEYTYVFEPVIRELNVGSEYLFVWEYYHGNTELVRIVKEVDHSSLSNATDKYTFADTGLYNIRLTIQETTATNNCESHTRKNLLVSPEFKIANAYSPSSADYFIIDPENPAVVLSFELFSRTGLKVYEQESPLIYWDGRTNSGLELGEGVYFYVIKSTTPDPAGFYSKSGFIHLFR